MWRAWQGLRAKTVGAGEDGMRLDRWFKTHYATLPHSRLEKLLRTGQVRVDGARAKASTRLAKGQTVRVPPLPDVAPPPGPKHKLSKADRDFLASITLYEDDDLLVLNKPSGIAVQGGSKTPHHIDRLLEGMGDGPETRPRLVHRLDRDTSGVLVVAKRRAVAAKLGRAFQTRSVRKIYWALTHGVPKPPQGKIEAALVKASGPAGDRVRKARPGEQDVAQSAVTHYAVVDRAGQDVALRLAQAGDRAAASTPRAYGHSSAIRSWAMRNIRARRRFRKASTSGCSCTRGASAFRIRRGRAWSTSPRRCPRIWREPSRVSASRNAAPTEPANSSA